MPTYDADNLRALIQKTGSIRAAERFLRGKGEEISARTIARRLHTSEFEIDPVGDEIDAEALIRQRAKRFERTKKIADNSEIRTIKLKTNKPIGIGFQGDGHLDNEGTDIALFFEHAKLFNGSQEGLYLGFMGDIHDAWVGRLQKLFSKTAMTDSETKALIEYYIANHEFLFFLLGNHDCVTMDTECLTRRGWLHYHDLTIDDEVLGYNVSTQQAEWQPISVMFKKPYNGEMVSVDNLHVDMMVTPGHRLLHKKGTHSQGWGYITAGEMDQDLPVILNAAQVKTGGVELTDDQLRLAGWLLTDAHYPNDGAVWIYQSKPESVDHITALLGRLGIAYTHHQRDRAITQICGTSLVNAPMTCHEFYIKAGPGRDLCKQLVPDRSRCPEWAMALTAEQFRVFFDTIVEGDGTWDGAHPHDKTCAVVYKSKTFLDSLQIALVTHGWRASVRQDNRNHWRLTTALRPETILTWSRNTKRVPAPENTEVWCLSVPLTNFMVRRNGKAYFTGNCWQNDGELLINVYKAIHDGGIIKAHQQKVRLLFPNGRSVIINARHKFPGSSMWMTQFGQLKTAHLDGQADIYVGGDKHVSGYSNGVHPGTKKMFHALQVASYKVLDEYPVELGLLPRDLYVCPVAIISPNARDDINLIRWEFDPFEGAERLKWERSRH